MSTDGFIESAVRAAGDFAGFFEHDGGTGYFYLYETEGEAGKKVLGSVHVCSGPIDFGGSDVAVRWDLEDRRVGVFIRGVLWAAFDCQDGSHYGGDYAPGATPSLPQEIELSFRHAS